VQGGQALQLGGQGRHLGTLAAQHREQRHDEVLTTEQGGQALALAA
jgi:hypothetical protein